MVSKRNDHYMIIDKKKIVFFFWVIIFINPNAQIKLQKKKNYETYIISSIIYNSI